VWFIWSFEVCCLLFALFALAVDLPKYRSAVQAMMAIVTVLLINLANSLVYNTGSLPGSNGSATRGNVALAGVIGCAIGNSFFIMASSLAQSQPNDAPADLKSNDV
jgi:hypothetical protein